MFWVGLTGVFGALFRLQCAGAGDATEGPKATVTAAKEPRELCELLKQVGENFF